jgi:hypothetical protein
VLAFGGRTEKDCGKAWRTGSAVGDVTSLSTEELNPADDPIRKIDAVLVELDEVFDGMYAAGAACRRRPR